jgi:hypothetical protein
MREKNNTADCAFCRNLLPEDNFSEGDLNDLKLLRICADVYRLQRDSLRESAVV